jgi:caa(3)-type oxidase subunit IV
MSNEHAAASAPHKPHVLPLRTYFFVWIGLLILTFITVRVSYFNFGTWNLIVAMGIATVKASLVALFFMHLKYDEKFNGVIFLGSLAFLGIFFVLTLADTLHRGAVDPIEAGEIAPVPGRPEFVKEHKGVIEGLVDSTLVRTELGAAMGAAESTSAADTTKAGGGVDTTHGMSNQAPAGAGGGH